MKLWSLRFPTLMNEKEQETIDAYFEQRWKHLPTAYDQEIKDLFLNVYQMGWMDRGTKGE